MSSKREKFVELAESRVQRALKDIQLIGNLSNRNSYEYTDEDVKKIFSALQKSLNTSKLRFNLDAELSNEEFKL
ncbi:hypothetical protein [Acinetobacter pseudolwoffii]|uniref:Uncharacterized protein n=1 Tax=Acinetobacter pseudolwoffii TaxID=2053287 RepID=A0A2H9YPK8_9GAMM|nr:hypothetical protein [Acinetobacter pseudolwoffii]PJO74581.1 hypothetical protein CWI32_12650 [Acinetobacter pseudolwoffii]